MYIYYIGYICPTGPFTVLLLFIWYYILAYVFFFIGFVAFWLLLANKIISYKYK